MWGLDFSEHQIKRAECFLREQKLDARLVCALMEEDCGLPSDYFDLVYSIYGIGWTTDLDKTFQNIYACLKKDGVFLFPGRIRFINVFRLKMADFYSIIPILMRSGIVRMCAIRK